MPLGILLPLVSNRLRTLKRVLVVALVLSLTIEATQFLLRFVGNPRAVDIDDVILNTLGACVGFALYKAFNPSNAPRQGMASVESHSDQHDEGLADSANSKKL